MSLEWQQAFREAVLDVPKYGSNIHYIQSADMLRRLIREGPLQLTDLRDEPERFFASHRVLSEFATQVGPGFGIRFTVQVNLFAGSILALGNPKQVEHLHEVQKKGLLGCFCLTERLAGVNSGLVVNTAAVWDEGKQMFLLDCPDEGSQKNWISQGLTADMAVVVATLFVKGKSYGPHAFVMQMRGEDGKLCPGVKAEDMGDKTIGNDLDNGRITFSKVWLPASALLNRYSGIENNEYVKEKGVSNMDMIGQRLYTGRTVIAASTLVFARTLYKNTQAYTDNKKCWNPKGPVPLSNIPQLSNLYKEADVELSRVEALCAIVEKGLGACLRNDTIPDENLVEQVACLKVKAIETTIKYCFRLKQEVGSYALMAGTGFEKMDYLQCCKFAEGDSRILMQKISRDRLLAFSKKQEGAKEEVALCGVLGQKLMKGGAAGWNDNWKDVYGLAEMVIERVTKQASGKPAALVSKL